MYIVIEIQKNGDQVATLVNSYATKNEADSKFFAVLSAAALSTIERHACSLLTDEGRCLRSEYYDHITEIESEEEA